MSQLKYACYGIFRGLITLCFQICLSLSASIQTNALSTPSLTLPSGKQDKIRCDSLLSSQKHTDLIITSRLADSALHLQLCGEFYQKATTTTAKRERKKGEKSPNKGRKIKEQEIWQLIIGKTFQLIYGK